MTGLSEVYASHSFKWYNPPENNPDGEISHALPSMDGLWLTRARAQVDAVERFREWAEKEKLRHGSTLRPDVIVWAASRDHPEREVIWTLYEAAAPRMDDDNRTFYPQMRETSFWIELMGVGS